MASTNTVTSPSGQDIAGIQHDPRRANLVNVGQVERILSIAGGSALAIYGIARRNAAGVGLALAGGELIRRGATGHSYTYQFLDLNTNDESPSTVASLPNNKGIRIKRSMTILLPAHDLYAFWRNVENSPLYMHNIESVKATDATHSHWTAKVPVGDIPIEWNSEITEDVPDSLIAWRVEGQSPLGSGGQVRFTQAAEGKGTVVTSEIEYPVFGGMIGAEVGKILGHLPEQEVRENLRQFKQLMESGEIPTLSGQPVGHGQPLSNQGRKN